MEREKTCLIFLYRQTSDLDNGDLESGPGVQTQGAVFQA